jgi:hypothetical protein
MYPFSRVHRAEHASCFGAGSKEETREALQGTEVQVLLVRLHGARPSLPRDPLPRRPTALGRFVQRTRILCRPQSNFITLAFLSCYSAIIVAIKHASRIYRAWLSNLVCTSSGRTLFLLAQSGSIYILRTKFVGTSIASVMNYQYNAKVRH